MNGNKQAIIQAVRQRCEAMVAKDIDTLDSLMSDDIILVHMGGKKQTKSEWLNDIETGEIFYSNIDILSLDVTVDGDQAEADFTASISARIYGMTGTWKLETTSKFQYKNNQWLWIN